MEKTTNKHGVPQLNLKHFDEDDAFARDYTQYDAGRKEQYNNDDDLLEPPRQLMTPIAKKSPKEVTSNKKVNSSNSPERQKGDTKVFNVSMKQTLPRPQDISDEDKIYLLPKLEGQNKKL